MAETESIESKSIRELTKAVKKSNAESRAQLKELAATTDEDGSTAAADAKAQLKKEDEAIKQRANLVGISKRRLNKANTVSSAIVDQKAIMEAQKKSLEDLGIDADKNKNFQKEQLKLAKMELTQAKSSGSSDAEDKAKQKLRDLKGNSLLGNMAKGITNMGKGALKSAAGKLPSMKSLLMTGGLAAILMFLKSPYFVKVKEFVEKHILPVISELWEGIKAMWGPLKKFFVETLIPLGKMLYEDYLKPIGVIFKDYFMKQWEQIKLIFNDFSDIFKLFGEDKWMEGIKKFFTDIVPKLGIMVDNAVTAIWNIIATVFGLEETDSVFGSIKGFFMDLYNDVVDWISITWDSIWKTISGVFTDIKNFFSKIFSWSSEEDENDSIVVKYIKKAVEGVKEWLGDLFKFDSTSEIIASAFNAIYFLPNIILKGLKLVTGWLLGLFGFDEKAKKLANAKDWSIGSMITTAFKGIVEWFGGLFDIDWKGLLTSIIPSWVPDKALSWLGIGDKPAGEASVSEADILKGRAADLEKEIGKGTGFGGVGASGVDRYTTEKELTAAKKELDQMKAQIRALDAKASVTAVDAKQIADNRKTNNVVYNQTQLRNQTSAAWAAAGSAW